MENYTELKVDVGVLKTQVFTLTQLCEKMDKVIEKLVDAHDLHINQVYREMDNRRRETVEDIGELHTRIDGLLDKVHESELRLVEQMEGVKKCITDHMLEEERKLDQILKWKWMVLGGLAVLSFIFGHVDSVIKYLIK
jgi:iron-sulfur cluster repair protein YtfE (RIC family)